MYDDSYQQWDKLAPRGLALIGLGVSVTGEAIVAKARRKSFLRWFVVGTLGLILINWGVSVFGEAVKHRAIFEVRDRAL